MKIQLVPRSWLRPQALALVLLLLAVLMPWASAFAQTAADGFNPGADGTIRRLFVQADGKLLVTGDFGTIAGGTRQRLARLRADGTLDTGFSVNVDGAVNSVAQLDDGRLLISGPFTTVDGVARASLALLRADGSLDTSYTLQPPGGYNVVVTLARQADGKIVLGGNFDRLGGQIIPVGIARLNADGSLDNGFVGPGLDVTGLAIDPQNRVLAVGSIFAKQYGFVRLRTDGTEDASFVLQQDLMWALFEQVERLAVQADGSILLAGPFTFTRDTRTWKNLLRVLPDGTLDEAFQPNPDGAVNDVVVQPDGNIVIVGAFAQVGGVARSGIARLRGNGSVDTAFNTPASGVVNAVLVQADGKIALGGEFSALGSVARQRLGRLERGGTPEADFIVGADPIYPGVGSGGFFGGVDSFALYPDGRLLIAGNFNFVGVDARSGYARINVDGTVDTAFQAPDARATAVVLQPDGRVLIAGGFASVNGAPRFGIARLLADGALDTSFVTPDWSQGGGSPTVTAILLQPDGKVVMAGYWRAPSMASTIVLTRFNADGSPDTSFVNPVIDSYYSTIIALALDKDGKLLVGGKYTSIAGVAQTGIARLNGDGTLDASFHADVDADVMTVQPQPDGKVLIGGWFGTVNGVGRTRIARLDAQGQLDTGFVPALTDDVFLNVQNIALQADGSMAIAGFADGYFGHVARLNADGTTDPSLELTADGPIAGLGQQADGKLLVTGGFTFIGNVERSGIARLSAPRNALQALTLDAAGTLRWTSGGSSPVLRSARFDYSTDGTTWLPLGAAAPAAGSWELAGAALPASTGLWVRARGFSSSGRAAQGSIYDSVVRVQTSAPVVTDRLFADAFETPLR